MTEQTVDSIDGLPLVDIPIEEERSERSSWRFCNSVTLPQSEVVFFTQTILIFVIVTACLLKLAIDKPSCEDMSFWVGLLSAVVGYALPNPRL